MSYDFPAANDYSPFMSRQARKNMLAGAQAEQLGSHNPAALAAAEMAARAQVQSTGLQSGAHLGAASISRAGGLDIEKERSRGALSLDQFAADFLKKNRGKMGGGGGSYGLATPIQGDPLHAEGGQPGVDREAPLAAQEKKKREESSGLFGGNTWLDEAFSSFMGMPANSFAERPFSYGP